MAGYSQIANTSASPFVRRTGNDDWSSASQYADMDDSDKNGGPNHLRAWMLHSRVNGQQLAAELGGNVTPGMVSDLVNSNRQLSAKWLRRIAPVLRTTPGMLLDHDPSDLDSDIVEIWTNSSDRQKRQLVEMAQLLIRTGTGD